MFVFVPRRTIPSLCLPYIQLSKVPLRCVRSSISWRCVCNDTAPSRNRRWAYYDAIWQRIFNLRCGTYSKASVCFLPSLAVLLLPSPLPSPPLAYGRSFGLLLRLLLQLAFILLPFPYSRFSSRSCKHDYRNRPRPLTTRVYSLDVFAVRGGPPSIISAIATTCRLIHSVCRFQISFSFMFCFSAISLESYSQWWTLSSGVVERGIKTAFANGYWPPGVVLWQHRQRW